jgi:hypothetical protein
MKLFVTARLDRATILIAAEAEVPAASAAGFTAGSASAVTAADFQPLAFSRRSAPSPA